MDSDRFDALTRSLGAGTTRRSLTRLLGGLALSGLLRPLSLAAKKRGNHKKGGKGKDNGKQGNDRTEPGRRHHAAEIRSSQKILSGSRRFACIRFSVRNFRPAFSRCATDTI